MCQLGHALGTQYVTGSKERQLKSCINLIVVKCSVLLPLRLGGELREERGRGDPAFVCDCSADRSLALYLSSHCDPSHFSCQAIKRKTRNQRWLLTFREAGPQEHVGEQPAKGQRGFGWTAEKVVEFGRVRVGSMAKYKTSGYLLWRRSVNSRD